MKIYSTIVLLLISLFNNAQSTVDHSTFWDVTHYSIKVKPSFNTKSVSGQNTISFRFAKNTNNPHLIINLKEPMQYQIVDSSIPVKTHYREGDLIHIEVQGEYRKNAKAKITVSFSGQPQSANRFSSPWKNGWVFEKDSHQNPWMSVAQEHDGVSLWLPSKDVWYDEPEDGILMAIETPHDLIGVGNGRLIKTAVGPSTTTYTWEVKNPINNYSIVPNVGKYVNLKETFNGEKEMLDLDYWILAENLDKAKKQFQQVKAMLRIFEYWFGPYPFYEDSYKLVETPYLGMEHQSNIAYGNGYTNGYRGEDLSGTGVGLGWDYIIVHESGHEWFANNITAENQRDMWIHESFTCYSETLFVEKYMGKKSSEIYVQGQRRNVMNDKPILVHLEDTASSPSRDMYYKGANMLHTIRTVVNNDNVFRAMLRGMNAKFRHQTVSSSQIQNYMNTKLGMDFTSIFDQYLTTTKIPILEFQQTGNQLKYRYVNVIDQFHLPIRLNDSIEIVPTQNWQTITLPNADKIKWNTNYYVKFRAL